MASYEQNSYAGAAADTLLAADISAGALSYSVTAGTGANYPDGSGGVFWTIIDYDNSKAEKIRCTGRVADTFTVPASDGRGNDGTTAQAHTAGAKVRHVYIAKDAQEANRAAVNTIGKITSLGDLLVGSGANTMKRLALGAARKALHVNAGGTDLTFLDTIYTLLTAKGSLIGATAANTPVEKTVGADGTVLYADSVQASGLRWGALPTPPTVAGPAWVGSMPPTVATSSAVKIGGAVPTANAAHYYRIRVDENLVINGLRLCIGTSSGNIDVGLYSDSGGAPNARITSSGSTACPASGYRTISLTPQAIGAGTELWLGIAADNTTVAFVGVTGLVGGAAIDVVKTQASAFPLPATATPSAGGDTVAILLGFPV